MGIHLHTHEDTQRRPCLGPVKKPLTTHLYLGAIFRFVADPDAVCAQAELKERLAKVYDVKDTNCIFVFKFRTHFGGGKSSGFGLIYDNLESAKKFEPTYRLVRNGLATKEQKSRKQIKERKNRTKKIRGVKKTKAGEAAKKK